MSASRLVLTLAAIGLLSACGGGTAPDNTGGATPAAAAPAREPLTLEELPAPWNEANLADGAMEFAKCRACHMVTAGANHTIGPNLHAVFERAPGEANGFRYSPALAAFEREVWTPEDLDKWLAKPSEFLPGSSMFFNGMNDERARRNLIGWLMIEASR